MMHTVYEVLIDRAERGMSDLLLSIADHFYCLGAGLESETTDAGLCDLLAMLEDRHRTEVLALRQWQRAPLPEESMPPIWLRALQERAAIERSAPPEGWLAQSAKDGRP
jgi:hypothetical protein